ncbi:MAG TPA: hypothetical protein VGH28_27295 [Polyangiaceae bacterium]
MMTLVALALMAWSEIVPRPLPVIIAMSLAQGIGTLAFLTFIWVVVDDLRTTRKRERESSRPPRPK